MSLREAVQPSLMWSDSTLDKIFLVAAPRGTGDYWIIPLRVNPALCPASWGGLVTDGGARVIATHRLCDFSQATLPFCALVCTYLRSIISGINSVVVVSIQRGSDMISDSSEMLIGPLWVLSCVSHDWYYLAYVSLLCAVTWHVCWTYHPTVPVVACTSPSQTRFLHEWTGAPETPLLVEGVLVVDGCSQKEKSLSFGGVATGRWPCDGMKLSGMQIWTTINME